MSAMCRINKQVHHETHNCDGRFGPIAASQQFSSPGAGFGQKQPLILRGTLKSALHFPAQLHNCIILWAETRRVI